MNSKKKVINKTGFPFGILILFPDIKEISKKKVQKLLTISGQDKLLLIQKALVKGIDIR